VSGTITRSWFREVAATMWTVQVSAVAGLTLGLAWLAHGLGRSAGSRARLRRLLLHRLVPWAAAGLVGAGVALLVLLPRPQSPPRRYADYLPSDGPGVGADPLVGSVLATMLIGGGIVLITVWLWLRSAGSAAWYKSLLRHCVPGIGGMLLLIGLVGDWIADRMAPASFGWYLYSPMTEPAIVSRMVNGEARAVHGIAGTLAALGLGVLTAAGAFRAGRRETDGRARP